MHVFFPHNNCIAPLAAMFIGFKTPLPFFKLKDRIKNNHPKYRPLQEKPSLPDSTFILVNDSNVSHIGHEQRGIKSKLLPTMQYVVVGPVDNLNEREMLEHLNCIFKLSVSLNEKNSLLL